MPAPHAASPPASHAASHPPLPLDRGGRSGFSGRPPSRGALPRTAPADALPPRACPGASMRTSQPGDQTPLMRGGGRCLMGGGAHLAVIFLQAHHPPRGEAPNRPSRVLPIRRFTRPLDRGAFSRAPKGTPIRVRFGCLQVPSGLLHGQEALACDGHTCSDQSASVR